MADQEGSPPAAAAFAATTSTEDDATIAQALQAVEQLVNVFGFSYEIANDAISACGTDITACYNYILDGGGEDHGGPVTPIDDCPHIARHVLVSSTSLSIGQSCSHYAAIDEDEQRATGGGLKGVTADDGSGGCPPGENWICLHCGVTRCSRYVNGHAVSHYERTKAEASLKKERADRIKSGTTIGTVDDDDNEEERDLAGHCIAVSLADLSVWCYECNAYLKHPRLDAITKRLEMLKFPDDSAAAAADGEDDGQKAIANENNDMADNSGHASDHSSDDSDDGGGGDGIPAGASYCEGLGFAIVKEEHINRPKNLEEMAKFILSEECKSIAILAGAGMSKASGIPDFRSAGGMYDTLRPELLTANEVEREAMRVDPTTVFEKGMFMQNPLPCLELKRSFILGTKEAQWKATIAHRFMELLHQKTGKLTRLYTQNIDGLEGQCKTLPREKVVPVHGSMDRAACEYCGEEADYDQFCEDVRRNIKDISRQDASAPQESSLIPCKTCTYAGVKPTIVLFRSNLPEEFFHRVVEDIPTVDLLIVVGTSLTVAPANSLVYRVPPTAVRFIVNNEPVGERLGIQYGDDSRRDVFAQGYCDDVFLDLICHLDWLDDLAKLADELPESSKALLEDRLAVMSLDEKDVEQGESAPVEPSN